ncbi:hypothetical protein SAMN06297251_10637 [Fulvimarina manganoxydans]|uniref:Uncharacterized protein n=1 Tax=Fulvimarina manganoxydans TaxID=937218 RepID=A0A1W2BDA4_9HYPH|nr:hypothetical protein SAMN06297251_10637 [Fulvimarina manganoxydans]
MQLDLLSWRPPEVEIIPFPARNRIGLIRRTASNIFHSRTEKEAAAFRRRSLEGLERQMIRAGIAEDRVAFEVGAFWQSVEVELCRLDRGVSYSRPGGDAA